MSLIFAIIFPFLPYINPIHYEVIPEIDINVNQLWKDCKLEGIISSDIFSTAISGMNQIEQIKNRKIITIIDYSKPSTEKRFYVINLESKILLYKCFVAHGKNSGENYAYSFSNKSSSSESCLGFFITAETYKGKNGYSLCIDGLENGINDSARLRSIVIHGAGYVSQEYINKYGRLGRSWGCPALPMDLSTDIIDLIANGCCLFIYGNDKEYLNKSIFNKAK